MRLLILFLLSTSLVWGDDKGLMQPYSREGSYPIAEGKAKLVIEKDSQGQIQYQIIRSAKSGEKIGGNPCFIKNSSFFVFPEDADHYWIYDGQSDIIHFVFTTEGMKDESLSCVPSRFLAMPSKAVALLPKKLQEKIK